MRFYGALYVFSSAELGFADGRITYGSAGTGIRGLDEALAAHQRYHGSENDRIRVALAPHGADTCGPELLRAVRRSADDLGCLVTIHLAQSAQEVEKVVDEHGMRPAEYLEHCGLLGPHLIAAHCIYCSDEELDILRRTDTTVVSCPRTFSRVGPERGLRALRGPGNPHRARHRRLQHGLRHRDAGRRAGLEAPLRRRRGGGRARAGGRGHPPGRGGARPRGPRAHRAGRACRPHGDRHGQAPPPAGERSAAHHGVEREPRRRRRHPRRRTLLVRDGVLQTGDERDIVRRGAAAVQKLWREARARGLMDDDWRVA